MSAEFVFLSENSWDRKEKAFLTLNDISNRDMEYAYEVFKNADGCRPIKLMLDYDKFLDNEPEDINEHLEDAVSTISKCEGFKHMPELLDNLAISNYSRWVKKNGADKFKVSFHFVFPEVRACFHECLGVAQTLHALNNGFDLSAFSGGLMRYALAKKPFDESNCEPEILQGKPEDFVLGIFNRDVKINAVCKKQNEPKPERKTKPADISKVENIRIKHIEEFIKRCYTKERATDYNSWFKVCCGILYCMGEEGIRLCDDFSALAYSGNNDNVYNDILNRVERCPNPITEKTLYFLAKEDNEDEYKKIMNEYPLINFDDWSQNGLARLIHAFKPNEFLYKDKDLYCFNGKFWEKDPHLLSHYISNEFKNLLKMYNSDCYDKSEIVDNCKKINQLGNHKFKDGIIREARDYFLNNDAKFDEKDYLLGFKNKVYDLNKHEFRDYLPDDYISMTCGYEWVEPTAEDLEEFNDLMISIFPNKDIYNTVKHILTTGLYGRCLEKFTLFNGSGGNGKGVLSAIVKRALGDYYGDLNNKILTEAIPDRCPELAKLQNKRIIFSREPDANIGLCNATIKEITGDSTIKTRMNHSNDTEIKIPATYILECNKRPKFSGEIEDADIRRLIDIEFQSRFTDRAELVDNQKIFKADPRFKSVEVLEKMKFCLLKVLFDFNKDYKGDIFSVVLPNVVKERTDEYLKKGSVFLGWFNEMYEKTNHKGDHITIQDVYNEYKFSEIYKSLSRNEKRSTTKAGLVQMFSSSVFFFKDYKERVKLNGNTTARNILIGWKMRPNDIETIEDACLGG